VKREDPYAVPVAPVADMVHPLRPISRLRIVGWGALVFTASAGIYMASGFLYSTHMIYGFEVDDILVSLLCFFLYFVFLHASSNRHLFQLAAVFLAAFLFGLGFDLAVNLALHVWADEPLTNPIAWSEALRNVIVCLLAYVAWRLTSRTAAKAA